MSKKLLSEAVVRRFAKLASLPVVNERNKYGGQGGDELASQRKGGYGPGPKDRGDEPESQHAYGKRLKEEDAIEDIEAEVDTALPDGEEVEMSAGEEEIVDEPEMGADLEDREALAMDVITAVADALNIEVDIEGAEGEPDMGDDLELDAVEDEEGAEDLEMDAVEDEEAAIMEALRGINYVPGKKEIVNEVAKRVARRLLKAKRADAQLKEALSTKRRRSPRRRRK